MPRTAAQKEARRSPENRVKANAYAKKYRSLAGNYEKHLALCNEYHRKNHETGAIRGLLYSRCNTALGLLRDSSENIEKMLSYLKSHAKIS